MPDEYREEADRLIGADDESVYSAMERDARRYDKAYEEEEASLR
jgi:hypothetical protein